MASAAALPYVSELQQIYDPSILPTLVINLYDLLVRVAASNDEIRDIMNRLDGQVDNFGLDTLPP